MEAAFNWLVNQLLQRIPKQPVSKVELAVTTEVDEEKSQETQIEFQQEGMLSASICCTLEAEKVLALFRQGKAGDGMSSSQILRRDGPYALSFWSDVKKCNRVMTNKCVFLNGKILGTRGSMEGDEEIECLNGKKLRCSSQALKDIDRWGDHAYIHYGNNRVLPLGITSKASSLKVSVGQKQFPLMAMDILEKLVAFFKNDALFLNFTHFFNQGPLNDMLYYMTNLLHNQWKELFLHDSNMSRNFHIVQDQLNPKSPKVSKLMIVLKGCFSRMANNSGGMFEAPKNLNFGTFYGVTTINLETLAGSVETHTEIFPENWSHLL